MNHHETIPGDCHQSAPNPNATPHHEARRRQVMTIIFAVVLGLVASATQAQSPLGCEACEEIPLQFDGETVTHESAIPIQIVTPVATAPNRLIGDARPAYVEIVSSLSNFDADADPDGWRVEVVLRDRRDRPVRVRANATFELTPRVPTADHRSYVDADMPPIRWSLPLEFDDDSVARARLPLRESLKPVLGWPSSLYPPKGSRNRGYGRHVRAIRGNRSFVTNDVRSMISSPTSAVLRVRVSVPTHGVFEAATPVRLRPAVLVDTNWPYR